MKKAIKSLLILFLIASMLFVLTGCGEEKENTATEDNAVESEQPAQEQKVEFSIGEWNNNVYTNDFLGIKFKLPQGWSYSSNEQIAEMMNLGNEFLNDEQKIVAEVAKLTSVYHMVANDPNTGNSVSVMSEKPAMDFTTEFYLNQVKTQLSAVESINYEIGETLKEKVAGREYEILEASATISGVKVTQRYYVYKMDKYFVSIIATSFTGEDGIKDMMKGFE